MNLGVFFNIGNLVRIVCQSQPHGGTLGISIEAVYIHQDVDELSR